MDKNKEENEDVYKEGNENENRLRLRLKVHRVNASDGSLVQPTEPPP